MSDQAETFDFQVETRQLLQLMINSVYSDKDVFLRELVSNASDALDKLRLERFRNDALEVDTSDLHVELVADPGERTLTVRDNGVGMSRAEVIDLIGKIANSGTAKFVQELKEFQNGETPAEEFIGQFGVGFYSTFMVADRVVLITRRAGESSATRWESTGEGTYTLTELETAPQGTSVVLHLKPADPDDRLFDYTDPAKLREIVSRYSDFITWPIRMGEETLNSRQALWTRTASEVTDEEYAELYKRVSHDWNDPLETMRLQIEGTLQYQALLFLPSHAGPDLFTRGARHGVQLYVNRVFVMDDCEALMPPYLRFVRGVVDSQDLALNVSREILQQDRQIEAMRRRLTRKVLASVKDLMTKKPEAYDTFIGQFGSVVKEGLLQDLANQEAILEICSFATTLEGTERTSLTDYVERLPEGAEHIYYVTGDSRTAIENSPHMEAFAARGREVLLLTDPIDEIWVDAVSGFAGKTFQSITKGELDLGPDNEKQQRQEDFAGLLEWMSATLEKDVKEVRLSSRLTVSPACVVLDSNDATPALINLYRQMGQTIPQGKRILELNPEHRLIGGLRKAHAERPDDATLAQSAELVYGLALLAEGGQLDDPSRFVQLMAEHLAENIQ